MARLILVLIGLMGALGAIGQNVPPKVSLQIDAKSVRAGQTFQATLIVQLGPDLHVYQNPPSEEWMIPITVKAATGTTLVRVTYPKGTSKAVGGLPKPALVHSGTVRIPVVLRAPSRNGRFEPTLSFRYQQCDDENCFPPASLTVKGSINVTGGSSGAVPAVAQATEPPPKPPAGTAATSSAPVAAKPTGLAALLVDSFRGGNYLFLFGALLIAGLLINLTPCVYPMIPITLGFFSGQSAGNLKGRLGLGSMYMVGIAVMYGLVGGIAAVIGEGFGTLFAQPWFNFLLAALMIGLALSMFDLYQIGIPAPLQRQLKGRSGPVGALIMGLLVGVAAAPCAGPVIVAIFAEVAKTGQAILSIAVFTAIGIGIGLPYLFLGALSSGAKSLPKAGGWMKAVKAVLGLVVIAVGLNYFLQALGTRIDDGQRVMIWAVFYGLAAAYLIFFDRSGDTKSIFAIRGTAAAACTLLVGMGLSQLSGPPPTEIAWQKFTRESWAAAQASGKPILIDATANWCAECKVIDAKVFKNPAVVNVSEEFVPLKIDWSTGVDQAYIDETAKLFDIKGLPHIVVTEPGGKIRSVHHSMESPEAMLTALRQAGARV